MESSTKEIGLDLYCKEYKDKRELYPNAWKTKIFDVGWLHSENVTDERLCNTPPLITHSKHLDGDVLMKRFKKKANSSDLKEIHKVFVAEYLSNCENMFLGEFWHGSTLLDYDLHEVNCQDFAVTLTNAFSTSELYKMPGSNHADKMLLRARSYAICSRSDIAWDGTFLTDSDEKQKKFEELKETWGTYELYNWAEQSTSYSLPDNPKHNPLISVIDETTLSGVESTYKLLQESNEEDQKIGWLNMANAHNTLGTYNVPFRGSQEEATATTCDAAVALGLASENVKGKWYTVRNYAFKGPHIMYKYGFHIPQQGAYVGKTRFVVNKDLDEQVECEMIAVAFADFRDGGYFQKIFADQIEGEKKFFFDGEGKIQDLNKYRERIRVDIESCLLTAIDRNIENLVLGASGCGAFLHDPEIEAEIWKEMLEKYEGYFNIVRFSILGGSKERDRTNVDVFARIFTHKEQS